MSDSLKHLALPYLTADHYNRFCDIQPFIPAPQLNHIPCKGPREEPYPLVGPAVDLYRKTTFNESEKK